MDNHYGKFIDINIQYRDIFTRSDMIEICSGITSGRVLNGELHTQRLQKFFYLQGLKRSLHETACKQMQIN